MRSSPAPGRAGKWAVRADPSTSFQSWPARRQHGLPHRRPPFFRSARDLGRWIEALKGATVLEAADSDDGSAEELKVRIGAK